MLDFAINRAYNHGMELLYDKEKLIEILTEFNNVTGIRISFLEDYNVPVIGIPATTARFARSNSATRRFITNAKNAIKRLF